MSLQVLPVRGLPEICHGAPLADIIALSTSLQDDDVLVVTSKIVSKAEGRTVEIDESDPGAKRDLALHEARRVLRRRGDLVITETHHGFVCANAGVDISNVASGTAVLLPADPDRSARKLRDRLAARFGLTRLGVVISDTFGRPWRTGLVDVAIGVAGFAPVSDLRGTADMQGRELEVTLVATADEIAAAADLVMGKASGIPAAVVRGLRLDGDGCGRDLIRPAQEDLFR